MARTAAVLLLAAAATSVLGHPLDHSHVERGGITPDGIWYHERDHWTHGLFQKRQAGAAPIGSPMWQAQFPMAGPPSIEPHLIPQEWVQAYNAARQAGRIPNIPVALLADGQTVYPGGLDPAGPEVCQSAVQCRGDGDVWELPAGRVGLNFDDGPFVGTQKLLDFLQSVNTTATHYFIGRNVVSFSAQAVRAYRQGHELAVHTWSHQKMSSLSDLGVVVELGWCMQAIYDVTEGRVPKYWRPPTGDMDNRVRAIASEVFGLTPVMWNRDTSDWALTTPNPPQTAQETGFMVREWLRGPKVPGLIILEHELADIMVDVFIQDAWPAIVENDWEVGPIGPMLDESMYQNAEDNTSPVVPRPHMNVGPGDESVSLPQASRSSSTRPQPTPTPPVRPPGGNGINRPPPSNTKSPQVNVATPRPNGDSDAAIRSSASLACIAVAAAAVVMLA